MDAHRLLLRNFSGRAAELQHRRSLWMARHVRGRELPARCWVAFIRFPASPSRNAGSQIPRSARVAFTELFSFEYRRRTILNSAFLLVSMVGLWAGSVYVPGAVTQIATRQGYAAADATRIASYATMLLSAGTIIGCLFVPGLAHLADLGAARSAGLFLCAHGGVHRCRVSGTCSICRRRCFRLSCACFFSASAGPVSASSRCGCRSNTEPNAGARCFFRVRHFVFGRFLAAGITFIVGAGVAKYGSIGVPVAWTALAFIAGLLLLPLGEETKDKPLPV